MGGQVDQRLLVDLLADRIAAGQAHGLVPQLTLVGRDGIDELRWWILVHRWYEVHGEPPTPSSERVGGERKRCGY
ncbi:hypothetical protein Asi03nite_10530 [Actinoplanes siamensis]|uniref:Uncharacterized protein n=1 Tax=Actinoplanes siamensis TaxID=1223317 RepID=A0A919N357_9ACTN|nr:hypothetical protein Asi03nite_10530 [Actinoplanes siamensis]